ncbi:hypothetical protein CVIRNUC_001012 [Coccomyxa viridis]|uniref:FAD-binding PCMH-type domain-containing protein n=1 Tax=Coccomyxa viridis TaxID=1274662 RepID=A0AAV1HVD0_9CHLO|nr:hypothetical protein CVIRNUC_001012 [Coccomyxa viridis]
MSGRFAFAKFVVLIVLSTVPFSTALSSGVDPAILQQLLLPLQTALKGTNLQSADVLVSKPNWSTLITETLAVLQKPGFLDQDEAVKADALRGLYTLWYAAGTSLGLLPPLPTQQKDILPAFAIDLPIQESMSIKDGRLGYTNKTLTWQNIEQSIPPTMPGRVIIPSMVEDVVRAVGAARAAGVKLRCIAHGDTWLPVFFDEGAYVLFISELQLPSGKRIEYDGPDAQGFPLVRVAPGVMNGELSEWTDTNAELLGYASLPTTVVITAPRMSGIISTGSHGKGLGFGAVADFVHSLKLVVADGTVVTYDATHPRFNEARMSFGLMGVIVEITFSLSSKRVAPDAPIVQDDNTFPTLREVFGRPDAGAYIKAFVTQHYSTEFLYFPLNQGQLPAGSYSKPKFNISSWDYLDDKVWITAATRAALPQNKTGYKKYSNKAITHPSLSLNAATYLGWLFTELGQQTGNIDIQVLSATAQVLLLQTVITTNGLKSIPAQVHFQPGIQQDHVSDAEFVFKVSDDFSNFIQIFTVAVEIARDFIVKYGSNPLNTALEWRFTGGSSVTLEGNRGAQDDIYCWIEVLGSVWTPHWDEFVRAVFDAWTAIEPDLKPHWAKWNAYTEDQLLHNGQGTGNGQYWEQHVKQVMAAQIDQWRPAVKEADPDGLFAQKYLYDLLGL